MFAEIVNGTASSIIRYSATSMTVHVVHTELDDIARVVDFKDALRVAGLRTGQKFPKRIDHYMPRRMTEYLIEDDPHFFEPVVFNIRDKRQVSFDVRGICRVVSAGLLARHIKAKHRTIHERCKVFADSCMRIHLSRVIDDATFRHRPPNDYE